MFWWPELLRILCHTVQEGVTLFAPLNLELRAVEVKLSL